ncbi:hypothetical protein SAMN05444352_12838 [Pseudomonas japonica]|uniref:Uncharacterized protein n=1 Tax=Pseudomonas japonica TaxID=256466 RepID=A0A239KRS3_9PSED|nr:hypothetical protein SAMN05444352_12838 [Pseudomonas japonica]
MGIYSQPHTYRVVGKRTSDHPVSGSDKVRRISSSCRVLSKVATRSPTIQFAVFEAITRPSADSSTAS